jgi:hypothetical protein
MSMQLHRWFQRAVRHPKFSIREACQHIIDHYDAKFGGKGKDANGRFQGIDVDELKRLLEKSIEFAEQYLRIHPQFEGLISLDHIAGNWVRIRKL